MAHFSGSGDPDDLEAIRDMLSRDGVQLIAPWPGPGVTIHAHFGPLQAGVLIPWQAFEDFMAQLLDVNMMYQEKRRDAGEGE